MGHDPHRHGRFTAIDEQRKNGLYKAETTDALFTIPSNQLFSIKYDDIHTHQALFQEVGVMSKP